MKYADVIVDISLEALDRVFQYLIPEELQTSVTVGEPGLGSLWPGKPDGEGLCCRTFR